MCVGNEVETLALETVSESGPEVFSAVDIANNNGRVQEGDQHFRRRFPGLCVTSRLGWAASTAAMCSGVRTGGRGVAHWATRRPPGASRRLTLAAGTEQNPVRTSRCSEKEENQYMSACYEPGSAEETFQRGFHFNIITSP